MMSMNKKTTCVLFFAVLLFAAFLRIKTFDLPHYAGDQAHYVSLAFKLSTEGVDGYNLRGLALYGDPAYPGLLYLGRMHGTGFVLEKLIERNFTMYDSPLHYAPYGFPAAIMISHRIFAAEKPFYMLAIPNLPEVLQRAGPEVGLRQHSFPGRIRAKQFYSVIVPFFFSLILISMTFFTSLCAYGKKTAALVSMFLMAISPINILSSQNLWADDMTSALMLTGAFAFIMAVKRKMPLLSLISGIFCGLSAVTKQNGAFIIIVIFLWHLASNLGKLTNRKTFLSAIFDKNLLLLGAGFVLGSGHWFWKVYSTYDTPFYLPHKQITDLQPTAWFNLVSSRPWYTYLLGIPYQNPLFALFLFFPAALWFDKKNAKNTLFFALWGVIFFVIFQTYLGNAGREHRYMMPAYPAFAIFAGYLLDIGRGFLDRKNRYHTGGVFLIILLFFSAVWSVPIGLNAVFMKMSLILRPF
jgi:hypothetical protein